MWLGTHELNLTLIEGMSIRPRVILKSNSKSSRMILYYNFQIVIIKINVINLGNSIVIKI